MGWPLRLVEFREGADYEPGECFYVPLEQVKQTTDGRWRVWGYELSDEYVNERMASRPPVAVQLPCGDIFVVDSAVTGERRGWGVSGEPPALTVDPSINIVGCYHGWIRNGELTDDCEGRQYERVEVLGHRVWRRKVA